MRRGFTVMKRLIAFLLLVFMPTFCLGDMVGYGGDKRRYVTDEEKSQFPYNTVVRINGDNNPGTGTFVSKDIILSCKHVVDNVADEEWINYYTADGQQHAGIAKYDKYSDPDVGVVVDMNAFSGKTLRISPVAKHSNNLMVIGYDSLKPLSDEEIKIVKDVYRKWIIENGRVTAANTYQAMVDVEITLLKQHNCTSENQKNCVHCSGEFCIFDDAKNMKVREGCRVIDIDSSSLYMDCPAAPGASGSAVIDKDTMQIIGVACAVMKPQIGQNKDALSTAEKPELYYRAVNSLINVFNE